MTETNSEPIIDLTELVSTGEQNTDEKGPLEEKTQGPEPSPASPTSSAKPRESAPQGNPSPLVSGLLPGLVEKIAGLSHDIDVLRDKMEQLSLRQNRLEEAHRRNAGQAEKAGGQLGERPDANLVTSSTLEPIVARIAALEEREEGHAREVQNETIPITALDQRLSSCEEQIALCATHSELEETCRALLASHFSHTDTQAGTNAKTMNTTESREEASARVRDTDLEELVGKLVARHLQEREEALASARRETSARIDELERGLAGAEEGLASLSSKLTDGLATIHEALSSLENSLSRALEQEKADAEGVERTTAALSALSARVDRLEETLLAEQAQRDDLAKGLAQRAQDDDAWRAARATADCDVRDTMASLEARLDALGQRSLAGGGSAADDILADSLERLDDQADKIRILRADQDRTQDELGEKCAYLSSRMAALEAQLGEENLEKAAARACLKVLREEIANILSGTGKA